jgi:hypothetical protein
MMFLLNSQKPLSQMASRLLNGEGAGQGVVRTKGQQRRHLQLQLIHRRPLFPGRGDARQR